MEEILASIRKIISEDQPEPAKAKGADSASKAVSPFEPEILDLTDEVMDEMPSAPVTKPAIPPSRDFENDIAFQNIEDLPETQKASTAVTNPDELISDSARNALGRVFENLDEPAQTRAPRAPGGSVEAVFERAVQEALEPVLQKWVNSNTDDVMQRLRPLILEWMDENLPPLIEAAVQKEIARAVKTRRR